MTTLSQHLNLGEPQTAGPLAVFPVFGPDPVLVYRSFEQAAALGAFVKELDGGASVRDLVVGNPTDLPLLIYEGEEVLGAQQNRTFDSSVLVLAGSELTLDVSCVEQGRWDDSRHGERFVSSPQAADPSLRRTKRATANRHAAAGLAARADQGEVWAEVESRLDAHAVGSVSSAMDDVYKARGYEIDDVAKHVHHVDGQVGALAFIGGEPAALDLVSRPEVFASLLPRLVRGYALDSLQAAPAEPSESEAQGFLHAALKAQRRELPTPGMGRGVRLEEPDVIGSGLEHDGELVQLCAFPAEGTDSLSPPRTSDAIARPSRRLAIVRDPVSAHPKTVPIGSSIPLMSAQDPSVMSGAIPRMRVLICNMGNGFSGSEAKHKRGWQYLRRNKEKFDVALLQETHDPRPWAHRHWSSVVWRPKYDTPDSRTPRWGSTIIARSLQLEEYKPDDRFPWLNELRGSVAIARTSTDPMWLASIHAHDKPLPEVKLQRHPWEDVPTSTPDGSLWETDVIPHELRRLFGDETFLWGGDLNSAVSMDGKPRFAGGNRQLRKNWKEAGSHDLRLRFHDEEQRTFFQPGKGPYQLDHVFADAATERRVVKLGREQPTRRHRATLQRPRSHHGGLEARPGPGDPTVYRAVRRGRVA